MNDVANSIMDSAERRMRKGGYNGFSFREIAVDVGVKSSSVHYHFPTKEKLAAAVIRRYTDRNVECLERRLETETDPIKVYVDIFRETIHSAEGMCPCSVLAAALIDLPSEVAIEVHRFFKAYLDKLVEKGVSFERAHEVLATVTGAQIVANALGDTKVYEKATGDIKCTPAKPRHS